jgi:hypothetical protein
MDAVYKTPTEPTVQQARCDRERELLARLHVLDREGKELDQQDREFRTRHMTFQNGRVAFIAADFLSAPYLGEELFLRAQRADCINTERNAVMRELVQLSEQREYEEAHHA